MGSKWFVWLVAVLIGAALAFPPMIFAAEKAAQPCAPGEMKEKKAPAAKAKSATGEVVSVDAKAGMLSVKAKDKEMSFSAESKAAKDTLEKVKKGDTVTVSYTEKDGKMVASSVSSAKAKKTMEKKGAEGGMKEEKKM